MPMPPKNYHGQEATVSMMELRRSPGDIVDRVSCGMTVHLEKNGIQIATIIPQWNKIVDCDVCIIQHNGSISGKPPVTFRCPLGGHY